MQLACHTRGKLHLSCIVAGICCHTTLWHYCSVFVSVDKILLRYVSVTCRWHAGDIGYCWQFFTIERTWANAERSSLHQSPTATFSAVATGWLRAACFSELVHIFLFFFFPNQKSNLEVLSLQHCVWSCHQFIRCDKLGHFWMENNPKRGEDAALGDPGENIICLLAVSRWDLAVVGEDAVKLRTREEADKLSFCSCKSL